MVLFVCWLYIEYLKEFYIGERIKYSMNLYKKNIKKNVIILIYKRIFIFWNYI